MHSGGMEIGRGLCQKCHSCNFSFRWNPCIPELILECSPEFTGMECNQNQFSGMGFNLICLSIIQTLINNNYNVWQPLVAKHCHIIFLPLTTTTPNPAAAAAVVMCPCECPSGPSRGCSSSSTTRTRHLQQRLPRHDTYASSTTPNATSPLSTTTYPPSPPLTTPTRHVTANN